MIFDLKKIQHTPFFKYSNKIIEIRKEEFESSEIYRLHDKNGVFYDMSQISKTYYGKKFFSILEFKEKLILKPEEFNKFRDFSLKLNLEMKVIDSNN
ncbi:MAG: hypothetical protein ACFFG0_49005 [Candidatus Thorarchaeota archaeon]